MSKICWAERGITVSHETIRRWCQKFGPDYVRKLKRRQGRLGDIWYLDRLGCFVVNVRRKRKSARPIVPPPKTSSESGEKPGEPSFPIVGIGASAGGLEAFKQLLHALPVDTGMGFVLVQHLAPTHASNLAEILSRSTRMTVMEVQDESRVIPNHVFVIPPDRNLIISGGALQLRPRESSGLHRSIDYFFRSPGRGSGPQSNRRGFIRDRH